MSDTATITSPEERATIVQTNDDPSAGFDGVEVIPTTAAQTTPAAPAPASPAAPAPAADEIFDEADYIKSNFGWDNKESALAEINRLRGIEKNPPKPEEVKFANEDSKRIFDAIKAGNVKPLRDFLERQERLDRVSAYDLSAPEQAADVIRTHLSLKNPDLKPAEIDRLMAKKYSLPAKPANNLDLTPEENAAALNAWQDQVNNVHMDMIIDAKMARPELSQLKAELVLPDIQQPADPQVAELQRKEAEQWQTMRNTYLQTLESDFQKFDGFKADYKDDEAEFSVAFQPTEQEKTALKAQLQNFNKDEFFDKRWFDENGKPRVDVIASDIYFLQNRDRILQKFLNEGGQQRNAATKRKLSNIQLGNQPQGTFQPSDVSEKEKQEAAIWEA